VMAQERAAAFTKRSIKTSAKLQGLKLAVSIMDVTQNFGRGNHVVTLVMLEAIRDYFYETGIRIGMKPAGGIRMAKQALAYLSW
jgi:deoxyribose-phosphate aldolase